MKSKIKVFFIVPTLYGGGAERIVSYVPQHINKEEFDATLVVIGLQKDSTYEVSGIPVIYLNKSRVLHSIFALYGVLYKHKPNIVLSTISHLNILMGLMSNLFPKIKFIGRHTIVSQTKKSFTDIKSTPSSYFSKKLSRIGMNSLDIVLCQSDDMFKDMQVNNYKVPQQKLRVIHNPMTDKFKLKTSDKSKKDVVKFITVARLSQNKGHERVVNALAKLKIPFHYTIIGDGAEKENISKLLIQLGLNNKTTHIPYTAEVPKYLANSDFFLMGTYAEGFPNSLIESCSVGTPIIAYEAPGGLNEIIEDGINGFMVDSEAAFIEKIHLAISRDWNPEVIRESVNVKFNKSKVMSDYEQLFREILHK